MTETVEFKKLIHQRGVIKSALTRINTFLQNYIDSSDSNIFQLKSRLPIVRSHFSNYQNIQNEIEIIDASDRQDKDREEFENNYFTIEASLLQLIDEHENSVAKEVTSRTVTPETTSISNVRLPILDLPTFNGNYSEWISFRDTFTALIHNSNLYTNIEKFHYLKSCLKSDSQKLIESFAISGDNYYTAWDALQNRYENLRIIAQEHVLSILNSPSLIKNSHTSLRKLFSDVTINLAGLKSMNQPTEYWDTLLIPIITSKFDFITKRDWETTLTREIPKFKQLTDFMEKRCFLLESLNSSEQSSVKPNNLNQNLKVHKTSNKYVNDNAYPKPHMHQNQFNRNKTHTQCHLATKNPFCQLCKKGHFLNYCPDILKQSIHERINTIKRLNLCLNCFRNNHSSDDCKSPNKCRYCKLNHNSILHQTDTNSESEAVIACANNSNNVSHTLLSTAEILIKKHNENTWVKCRVLLDQGSQVNFISRSLQKKLGLETSKINMNITGINNVHSKANEITKIHFKSRCGNYQNIANCIVLENITDNLPPMSFNVDKLHMPGNLNLADPNFNISGRIDALLGAEIFWKVLLRGQIKSNNSHPHFQETCLGWLIGGNINNLSNISKGFACNLSLNTLNKQICKFWEIEDYSLTEPSEKLQSLEDKECEQHFEETTTREPSGRFMVKLPFKSSTSDIGDTKTVAIKRFISLENRFKRDPSLKIAYYKFIQEYVELNHMSKISYNSDKSNHLIFLPHHGVIKESSNTTKLRVVFDGSVKSSTNISLNDTLRVGPKIQNDLIPILIRFRLYQYVFTADISKMYRQILVAPKDRIYQNIIWRDNPLQEYEIYQLNTVTYGLSCAPYLAVKCLQKLAYESKHIYPEASRIILDDFYIDDVLTGTNSLSTTIKIRDDLIRLLKSGCFQLLKFASNEPRLLSNLNQSESKSHLFNFDKNGDTKTLGLIWNCQEDNFRYEINFEKQDTGNVTKRKILSMIAKIYDPLQLIGPVIVKAKLIMQALWKLKLGWDERVPQEILLPWSDLVDQLNFLNNIRIPRKVINSFPYSRIELHGFCDSSQAAYGACVYIRTINANQVRNVIRKCIVCFRAKPTYLDTIMGNLSVNRITVSRPFSNCGVDYGGPIIIKEGTRRSKRSIKAYICLFVCFASKVIHLELVTDLTTESFINALKRFISRRGIVSNIYSDNATNFQGAQRELKNLFSAPSFEEHINAFLNSKNIRWHFIPARSPHVGGIWEAGIKSVKFHIKRVVGNTLLTYEEMLTLLTLIEACLNSRPLTPLTEDPKDLDVLTPGHFLIGCPLTAMPEPSLQEVPANRLSRRQRRCSARSDNKNQHR